MKPYVFMFLVFAMLSTTHQVFGQNKIVPTTTFDTDLDNWTPLNSASFTVDGTASGVDPFWGNRQRIQSDSRGGAAVLFVRSSTGSASLRSPFLDFTGEPTVVLTFNQYYRNFAALTQVNIYRDSDVPVAQFPINTLLNQNVETAAYDTIALDISAVAGDQQNIRVEFELQGQAYFWLLDDINFFDEQPFPQTNPRPFGQFLADNEYPFEVDSADWAYVPNELIVQFKPGIAESDKQALRDTIGARKKSDCVCGKLELWEIDGSAYFDQNGQNAAGGTIDILTNKIGTGSRIEPDGVDLNYYNGVIRDPRPSRPLDTLTMDSIVGIPPSNASSYRIAIVDTGIDYNHPDLQDYLRLKPDRLDGSGNVADCYSNDPLGWNFVDSINNVYDNNSHGTHVAGILADYLSQYEGTCGYEFVTYKTHDRNGIATLFDVACATYQSIEDSVIIINDSWGFFGDSSIVLRNAIDSAALHDILVISAAGNDSLNLDTLQQYPACYQAPNIVSVTTADTLNDSGVFFERAPFANFSPAWVNIMGPGVNVESTVPAWWTDNSCGASPGKDCKSGTSMSTPAVSAAAALAYCCGDRASVPGTAFANVRNLALGWADLFPLNTFVEMGRYVEFGSELPCEVDAVFDPRPLVANFRLFPNPTTGPLTITTDETWPAGILRIYSTAGQLIRQYETREWLPGSQMELRVDVPAGMYWAQIQGETYLWTGKFIIGKMR